jgi:hypothetical protein
MLCLWTTCPKGSNMDGLPAPVEDFLHTVSWVSELEAIDAELIHASKSLRARLERAEDIGDHDLAATTIEKLGLVGDLRGYIARELSRGRAQGGLQVLAQP